MTQTDNKDQALVPLDQHLPPPAVSQQGDGSILQRMARGALEIARRQALASVRYRVGGYELAEPDYRQVLLWAERLELSPEKVLVCLETIRFRYYLCNYDADDDEYAKLDITPFLAIDHLTAE